MPGSEQARCRDSVGDLHQNYVGEVLGGHFKVQNLKLRDEYLDIYEVKDLHEGDTTFEMQAFLLSCPLAELEKTRRKRMKRIFRSRNFHCEFTWGGRKFLVSQVERSEAEWRNLVQATVRRGTGNDYDNLDRKEFSQNTTPLSHPSLCNKGILSF
ncbi:hypothetical protein VTK73DRAFT_3995 [Phialemonium thermophilum]|uniref:PH domain-containing protein n=1 Tax=Phialemonium thermophilum TaxID=223376 RepID=A0ABR3WWK1_9PEZI